MCFTIAIHATREELERRYKATFASPSEYYPGYYFSAFTLPRVPVITNQDTSTIQMFNWGLIPSWVKDETAAESIRTKTFNARAETITEKPSFRSSMKTKRCLVIGKGFFEWQSRKNEKIPYFIYLKDEQPFSFAGLYDNWANPVTGEIQYTFTIITTSANPLLAEIHNTKKRMPVILPSDQENQWVNPDIPVEKALSLLKPYDENLMKAHTVSKLVSKQGVDKNIPEAIAPFNYTEDSLF